MRIIERTREKLRAQLRSFVLGSAVAHPSVTAFGVDPSMFSPDEYGEYIAKSNGVYTCATGRADLLTTMPPKLYRKNPNGQRDEVTSGNLYTLLHKVNPHWTWRRLIRMTELSLCLWGEAFWFLERGASTKGTPREIWWGKPSRVTVFPDPTNYIRGFEYELYGERLWFDPHEVIWFRFENPIDEFSGLSPIAAARLAADYANESMYSNRMLFRQGNQMGGVMWPKDRIITAEQAQEIEHQIDRRTKGVDKAHRWSFFRMPVEVKEFGVTPKDAEFLGGLEFSLEEICRAYKWPLDLVGGQRTYENYNAAMKAAYTHAVIPESTYLADEIQEQLFPMFAGEADVLEFDTSEIAILQEAEGEEWTRAQGQIQAGAITINEWRKKQGLDPVPWGDTWWASMTNAPAETLLDRPAAEPVKEVLATDAALLGDGSEDEDPGRAQHAPTKRTQTRGIEFGGAEHERIWRAFDKQAQSWEKKFSEMTVDLFKRQQESVLATLENGRVKRAEGDDTPDPFDLKRWVKEFRMKSRRVLRETVTDMAQEALREAKIQFAFDVEEKDAIRFIETRAQRFAVEVNETTWKALKESLSEGMQAGEGIDQLKIRVEDVMGGRIRSTPETIARTEVIGASNGGRLLAYKQSKAIQKKGWLAALDERTRESHLAAHRQYQETPIGLDEEFEVGGGRGQAPGQIGIPSEDINCRCTMVPVIEEED